jgi:hypothetical protein
MPREVTNLQQMLGRIETAAQDSDQVTLGMIVNAVGSRSFGPLLLVAGLVLASPLSGIPGMPTSMGVVVLLIAGQLLFRQCCWLPRWLLDRSIARGKLCKAVGWTRRPARVVDGWLHPRLPLFIQGPSRYAVAAVCAVIAIGMPFMEVVPFSATVAGIALTAFGLSLIAQDGLLALIAFATTAAALVLVASRLL